MEALKLSIVFVLGANIWAAEALTRAEHDAIAKRDYKEWENMYTKLVTDISNDPSIIPGSIPRYHTSESSQANLGDMVRLSGGVQCVGTLWAQSPNDIEKIIASLENNLLVVLSESRPVSVHELRPSDIQIVAALGDSITAGFGLRAQFLPTVFIENRGEVWCAGSDRELRHTVITLPNILKKFNPHLQGSSICNRYPGHPYMNWFNVARSGARSTHMVSQAEDLVDKLRADENIDFLQDWKLVTILIGGNDLCRACSDKDYAPPVYAQKIADAIDVMYEHIPRAMINLVAMLDVSLVNHVNHSEWCNNIHQGACPCALSDPELTGRYTVEYYEELRKIVDTGRWDENDDFTVVLQPMMRDLYPDVLMRSGELAQDYFAPDCFHPGARGHQELAAILWAGMMTPVGQKPFKFFPEDLIEGYKCPTKEHPYIFTKKNSPVTDSGDRMNMKFVTLFLVMLLGASLW